MLLAVPQGAFAGLEDPALEVVEAVWTSNLNGMQFTDKLSGQIHRRRLCLWTRIEGGQPTLDRLERDGKLPIRHVWKHSVGPIAERHLSDLSDAVTLGIGSDKLLKQLREEAKAKNGRFDWRTWSCKGGLAEGDWSVEVKYRDSTPVMCGAEPCLYRVNILP